MFAPRSFKTKNRAVTAEPDYERDADAGQTHLLICALDYKGTGNELTCTLDGNNMQALARACGVQSMEVMYDNECTSKNVENRIKQMAGRMGEDDYFIFYYSGHGTSMEDEDGDEEDGKDEALCFMAPNGQLDSDYFMSDDDFAELLSSAIPEGVRILILTDCCHSGTIGDLEKDCWEGREVISMTGCTDSQTSGDIGKGGIFTHSMLLAIEKLSRSDEHDFSVGLLYNATVKEDDAVFKSAQDIQMECPPNFKPNQMAWPLIPKSGTYRSPLSQAAASAGVTGETGPDGEQQGPDSNQLMEMLQNNPQLAQQFGIKPEMLPFLQGLSAEAIKHGPEYIQLLEKFGASGQCVNVLKQAGCAVQ